MPHSSAVSFYTNPQIKSIRRFSFGNNMKIIRSNDNIKTMCKLSEWLPNKKIKVYFTHYQSRKKCIVIQVSSELENKTSIFFHYQSPKKCIFLLFSPDIKRDHVKEVILELLSNNDIKCVWLSGICVKKGYDYNITL